MFPRLQRGTMLEGNNMDGSSIKNLQPNVPHPQPNDADELCKLGFPTLQPHQVKQEENPVMPDPQLELQFPVQPEVVQSYALPVPFKPRRAEGPAPRERKQATPDDNMDASSITNPQPNEPDLQPNDADANTWDTSASMLPCNVCGNAPKCLSLQHPSVISAPEYRCREHGEMLQADAVSDAAFPLDCMNRIPLQLIQKSFRQYLEEEKDPDDYMFLDDSGPKNGTYLPTNGAYARNFQLTKPNQVAIPCTLYINGTPTGPLTDLPALKQCLKIYSQRCN